MGAEQSSSQYTADAQEDGRQLTKRCYYEVLGVDRQANDDEIKKAYRAKALELHPDRNYGNVDNATKKFADVQSAYQVLSDPQERAWYDSHRDTVLQNFDPGAGGKFEHHVQLTSAGDIVRLISNFSTSMLFTDNPNGFFGIFRSMFAKLAKEEATSCDWEGLEVIQYPSFGNAEDSYEVVRPFYAAWMGFATRKTFSWKDIYKCTEAPDRRIRRLMEKKNKRLRDENVREFNDAVRSLVRFVRKRDPRYAPNFQSEANRQKSLRDAATAQAARSRAANRAKLDAQSVPNWAQARDVEEEAFSSETDPSDEDQYECIVCAKVFKSENQYDAHEKSKKHIKALRSLREEMRGENKRLNIHGEVLDSDNATEETDLRHGNSSTHIEKMQDLPLAEEPRLEYSSPNYNVTGASAHADSGSETNVFRGIGVGIWGTSALGDILARDGETDDKSR